MLMASAILYQPFILSVFLLDSFESSAQVLYGEAVGAGASEAFMGPVRRVLGWAALFAHQAAPALERFANTYRMLHLKVRGSSCSGS